MCDSRWNALAEFHIHNKNFLEDIYCLCSRVFTWSNDGILEEFSPTEEDSVVTGEENKALENPVYCTSESTETTKQCGETEPVSCYCSASHTDNISTDEHDSLRDSHVNSQIQVTPRPLQLSDSGADLTEYVGSDNSAWHKYWALNGERLIWESWIAKYSAYINPEYLQGCQEQKLEEDSAKDQSNVELSKRDKGEGADSLKFSFDSLSPHQDSSEYSTTLGLSLSINFNETKESADQKLIPSETVEKNRMLIRNLSGSDSYDKLYREGEGWNPLSPVSNDCETEAERLLLSSRCASRTGSTARTIDSMTNVTRMTISSIDLSESSKHTDSFSSVSSVQSSITSTSSEDDDVVDYDQQWNELWTKHYEQEYLDHYKKFLADIVGKSIETTEVVGELVKDCNIDEYSGGGSTPKTSLDLDEETSKSSERIICGLTTTNSEQTLVNLHKTNFKRKKRRGRAKRTNSADTNTLSAALKLMKMEESKTSDSCKSDVEVDLPTCSSDKTDATENKIFEPAEYFEEINQMNLMGLPVKFKTKQSSGSSKNSVKKLSSLKQSSEEDDMDQSSSNRIKAAFNLIGLEMHENMEPKFKGDITYKMKHIRAQNRHLKFPKCSKQFEKPKHIHFDDDGFVIPENNETDEVTVQNSHQDELLGMIPSSSTEGDEAEPVPEELYTDDDDKSQINRTKKKKRKRKIAVPLEIKDNPKLRKFWQRRYSLFSKFDLGIKLDEESWFSVTPELIAQSTANRCCCDVIVDAFCGAGGNAIQFAVTCKKVIAIDIDPQKIEMARHNAEVYGVRDQIEFICGDFFQLAESLRADVVFLSPPWGGPKYLSEPSYDLELLQPVPFSKLFSTVTKITKNIALFLPKNSNTYPLVAAAGPGGNVELEQNFLNKKLVALTAYYGSLIKDVPSDE